MGKFVIFIVAIVLVVGLWSGGWLYAAGEIRQAVDSMADNDGETDPKVTCGTLNVSGFPFRFDVECREATVVSADTTATLAAVRLSVLAYNPTQAHVSALSPIRLADAFSGAQSRIEFESAAGSARLTTDDTWRGLSGEGWRIARISVVADAVKWVDTIVGDIPLLDAEHLEAHLVDIPEQHDAEAGTAALAAYATLTGTTAPALGVADGEAILEAELTGLPDDVRALSDPGALARWQQAGGQLRLVNLKGTAGEEFVESSGTIGVDSGARVDGQITIRHRGLVERMGDMIPAEWKPIVLGGQADDGSYAQTLTIKAGVVFSGIIPVSVIPPLL